MNIAKAIATTCPDAFILVITNPVNSLVPMIGEVLKKRGRFYPGKLFGATTLDAIRASTFTSQATGCWNPPVSVPVVGGHSTNTIIPLFSQATMKLSDEDEVKSLTVQVQQAGEEVIKAKARGGASKLCIAYAAARYVSMVTVVKRQIRGLCLESSSGRRRNR